MAEVPHSEAASATKYPEAPPDLVSAGRESSASSQVAVRMASYRELVARATDVFGDAVRASRWLSLPNVDLGGKVPLQLAQENGYDAALFESIWTRIEHGIDY